LEQLKTAPAGESGLLEEFFLAGSLQRLRRDRRPAVYLQRYRNTKIGITPGDASAMPAFVLGVFDKCLVLLLIADVKTLRDHITQVFGMYSRAAFHIKLWVWNGHDYKLLSSCD